MSPSPLPWTKSADHVLTSSFVLTFLWIDVSLVYMLLWDTGFAVSLMYISVRSLIIFLVTSLRTNFSNKAVSNSASLNPDTCRISAGEVCY